MNTLFLSFALILAARFVMTLLLIRAALFRLHWVRITLTCIFTVRMILKKIVSDISPMTPQPT